MKGTSSPLSTNKESFSLKQNSELYTLSIEIQNQNIIKLNIVEDTKLFKEYEINFTLDELKQMHNIFAILNSSQEFIKYMRALIENNQLTIIKENENQISIKMIVEYLYIRNEVRIDLNLKKKINLDIVVNEMKKQITDFNIRLKKIENNYIELKEENHYIKIENTNIKNENKNLKEEIKTIKEENSIMIKIIDSIKKEISGLKNKNKTIKTSNIKIYSSIMEEEEELEMIKSTINQLMNLEIKEIKKIYQATIDGEQSKYFHKKCDNIKNTLVLYKTKNNRRFGGFASEVWENNYIDKCDKYCFLFSLDEKKIYKIKGNNYFQISSSPQYGPSFANNGKYCIAIKNSLDELYTNESDHKNIFNGENNALSEDGNFKGTNCENYEVFQLQF